MLKRWRACASVAALIVVHGCSDLRVKMEVFNTADDARRAGALSSAWLPPNLPPGATDLRAGHLPDGRHWGVFVFQPADANAVRALTTGEITSGAVACDPPGRLEFWPRLLRGARVEIEQVRSTGFRVYRGNENRTYAINWGQGRAYYWRE